MRFFIEYRQRNWLVIAEFVVNNKVHTTTKVLPFIANYGKELRMGVDIKKKEKVEKTTEFMQRKYKKRPGQH